MNWKQFLENKGISLEDYAKKSVEEMAQLQTEYSTEVRKELESKIEKASTKEEFKVLQDAFDTYKSKKQTELDDLQEQLNVIKDKSETGSKKSQSLDEVLKNNQEDIKKSFETKREHNFTVNKALTLSSAVTGNTDSFRDDTLSPLATKTLSLYDMFRKVRIGKNNNGTITYRDWDAATTARAAAMVSEGAAFPESTVKWEQFSIIIKKIGDSIPWTAEFEYDLARFADELKMFLEVNVKLVEDFQLREGTGTGNDTFGLQTYAPAYVPAASSITDASRYDLIVKVAEDLTKGLGNKFRANYAIMNLTEINKMKLKKDANNNYIIPPFVSRDGKEVSGITVIEDNGFADNTMIVGDSRYGTIYEDEDGYTITTGVVNNQFLEDEETLKARKRMCFLIKESEKIAHRKVTDIGVALTTLAS